MTLGHIDSSSLDLLPKIFGLLVFINACCFGAICGACFGIFNALSSGLRLLNFTQIAPTLSKLWRYIDFWGGSRDIAIPVPNLITFLVTLRSKSTWIPNFGDISLCMTEALVLPVSVNKRLPCWNSTISFDFYVCVIIGMSLCICLPNFVQIGTSATELWRHNDFQDGGC